jgi:AcrR family transcriptional regulator
MVKREITTREHLLVTGSALLAEVGTAAFTTRLVCERAGVTAPTLYHHFGDKDGLLRAIAEHELQAFFLRKQRTASRDAPRMAVRRGWDDWIAFARANPAIVSVLARGGVEVQKVQGLAESIVQGRIEAVPRGARASAVSAAIGAKALVAGANAVIRLELDGTERQDVDRINLLLRNALLEAVLGPEPD